MRVFTPHDLGRCIARARQQFGWTQAQLAQKAGVTRVWLSGIENGKPRAEIGLLLRTLAALDLVVSVTPRTAPDPPKADTEIDLADILRAHTTRLQGTL